MPTAQGCELTRAQFFVAKMTVAKEIYEKLAWMLGIYVEQMHSLVAPQLLVDVDVDV